MAIVTTIAMATEMEMEMEKPDSIVIPQIPLELHTAEHMIKQ